MNTRRPLAALALALASSCTQEMTPPPPSGISVTATLMTKDFETAFEVQVTPLGPLWSTVPEIFTPFFIVQQDGGPDTRADVIAMTAAAQEGITLVDLASGALVQGEVITGFADWHGVHSAAAEARAAAYSFVPAGDLADGWYVLRVDLSGWRPFVTNLHMGIANLNVIEPTDHAYVRVHVGSLPTWWATGISCTFDHAQPLVTTGCRVGLVASEPIADWGNTTLEVLIDGAPATCDLVFGDTACGCQLPPFQRGAAIDLHFTSSVLSTPEGSHDARRHIVYDDLPTGSQFVEVSPDFGIAIADAAR